MTRALMYSTTSRTCAGSRAYTVIPRTLSTTTAGPSPKSDRSTRSAILPPRSMSPLNSLLMWGTSLCTHTTQQKYWLKNTHSLVLDISSNQSNIKSSQQFIYKITLKTNTPLDNTSLSLLLLPLRRGAGAGAKASSWKDYSTLSTASVAGASRALLLIQRRQNRQFQNTTRTNIMLKSRIKDTTFDIFQPNYRSSVRKDTK